MNKKEFDELKGVLSNPAKWAETFLRNPLDREQPLELRSYQKEVLEASRSHRRIVLRYGRRMGKCSYINDLCLLSDGSRITFGELLERYNNGEQLSVLTMDDNLNIISSEPVIVSDNGIKPVYTVETKSGRKITATTNHPLLTLGGWKKIDELIEGNCILVPSEINIETKHTIDNNKVKFLAYVLSDGSIIRNVSFTNSNELILNEFKKNLFGHSLTREELGHGCKTIYVSSNMKNNEAIDYLRSLGLYGKTSHTKFIPNEIMKLSKPQLVVFLSRLYACDGWASVSKSNRKSGNCEIGYCSVSEELAYGVGHLLSRFGIRYFITEKKVKYKGTIKRAFQICIRTKKDILNFIEQIGIFGKEEACKKVKEFILSRKDKDTYFDSLPTQEMINNYSIIDPRKNNIRKQYHRTSNFKFKEYAEKYNNSEITDLVDSSFFADEIKVISYEENKQTIAVEVPNTHNYIQNDVITHNTVALCADTLWWVCVSPLVRMFEEGDKKQKRLKVLIATPYETQIKMIWSTYLSLIGDSPLLKTQLVKVRTSDVHLLEFENGSSIEGYTIGISSSNKGTSLRGLDANIIFIDEMDAIPREIIDEVLMPIWTGHPDCILRVSSTPTGERSLFWEWCTKAEEIGWWHKHYPSWHPDNDRWISIEQAKEKGIPVYESTEFQAKVSTPADVYTREYGAEFGEEYGGVYKHTNIDKSLRRYSRTMDLTDTDIFDPGFKQNPNNIYIMGVDWNSYINGGQIVVTEYCSDRTVITYPDEITQEERIVDFTGKYRLFYRRGIRTKDSTQRKTREEIIRLVRNYKIDFIYVDYGAGDTNIEELTYYGKDHPELRLEHKLRVIDSGAVVEHWDPILREKIKKRNKTLMVNFSVLFMDEGLMILPKEEDMKTRLIGQMRGYQIKNMTSRGEFAYEGDDHILDAFHLSIYGFQREFGDLLRTHIQFKIFHTGDPRAKDYPTRNTELTYDGSFTGSGKQVRDPEKPIYKVQTPQRIQMPSFGRRSFLSARSTFNGGRTRGL